MPNNVVIVKAKMLIGLALTNHPPAYYYFITFPDF